MFQRRSGRERGDVQVLSLDHHGKSNVEMLHLHDDDRHTYIKDGRSEIMKLEHDDQVNENAENNHDQVSAHVSQRSCSATSTFAPDYARCASSSMTMMPVEVATASAISLPLTCPDQSTITNRFSIRTV